MTRVLLATAFDKSISALANRLPPVMLLPILIALILTPAPLKGAPTVAVGWATTTLEQVPHTTVAGGWATTTLEQGPHTTVAGGATVPTTPRQKNVEAVISGNPAFKGAQVSVLAVGSKGDTLVSVNPHRRMVPASNVKLISSGAALTRLGASYRFETRLAYSGTIEDGTLRGDLYIIGGADPTLGSGYLSCAPADSVFSVWSAMLSKAGVKAIDGRIIGDPRFFDGQPECPTWSYEDVGTYYGAGPTGLNYYENVQDYDVTPGLNVGDPITAWPSKPETPWMRNSYSCTTGPAGTGDQLYLYNTDLAPFAELRGSYAVDREGKTIHCSNRFPALTCAYQFQKFLESRGVETVKGSADVSRDGLVRPASLFPETISPAVDSLSEIGTWQSGPLRDIIRDLNHQSDNFYAETLLKMLGRTMRASACYDSSLVALRDVLKGMGFSDGDLGEARLVDGSGLSRENYVSAAFFVHFLRKMASSPCSRAYRASLPQPGKGTLASRFPRRPRAFRERFRMKSGSMDGVRCFSGYISDPAGGEITFSVLVNNMTVKGKASYEAMEQLLEAIAQ